MIELLCIDVDGTLTNGDLHYNTEGEVFKTFNVKDGLGIAYWQSIGRKTAIITGRESKILPQRAKELKIDYIFMGVIDKGECVRNLKTNLGLDSASLAAIGDDMNDIAMFREVGLSFAPLDCANALKQIAHIHLTHNGGCGAVREAIEMILQKEQLYEAFIQRWQ